ncbi:sporulation integral membrane protein YtvI [Planomicrobium sp. YIM 101495]|uniref:sporulation integral membrane protein YtvI n=1 Tax=Planomicrobium sp. YIM 101495 TaxID=2665160 RepID=UPI0013FBF97C|nr:sporulation integral membrane protein YtvI [Planomicrobium sp. YIM 101495]
MSRIFNKKVFAILIVIAILLVISYYIFPLIVPLILALLTAIFLEPFVGFAQRKLKISRKLSVTFIFSFFLIIVTGILYWTVTQLFGQIIQFSKNVPDYINSLTEIWENFQEFFLRTTAEMPMEIVDSFETEMIGFLDDAKNWILTFINYDTVTNLLADIPSFLVSFLVFLIALFLFMLDLPNLKVMLFSRLKDTTAEKVRFMTARLNHVIFGFLKAQLLVSCIIFIVSLIGLYIIIPEYALVMSLVIWIIDFIPILGSIIILAPWSIYQFIVGDTSLAIQLAILALILLIIRRTVEPKVMGTQIGLSPLATLIAMFIGLQLFGVLGFFIGPLIIILITSAREAGMVKVDFKI